MRLLYGRHYRARHAVVAGLVPDGASVIELCCGPGLLYVDHLRARGIDYLGLDVNPRFVEAVRAAGGRAELRDVGDGAPLPEGDLLLMQASLYHFLPDPGPVVDAMLAAARREVVLSEPVRNLATSRLAPVAALARRQTDPGTGMGVLRFDEPSLDAFLAPYSGRVLDSFLLPGGREKVVVLDAQAPA